MLRTGKGRPNLASLLSMREVADLAIDRWVLPRAQRRPEFRNWTLDDLATLFGSQERIVHSKIARVG